MINKYISKIIYQYNVGSFLVAQSENKEYIQALERKYPKAEYGMFFLKYFLDIHVLSISIKEDELYYNYTETIYDDWDARAPMTYRDEKSYSEVMNLMNHNQKLRTFWKYVENIKEAQNALKEDYNISESTALEAYNKYIRS